MLSLAVCARDVKFYEWPNIYFTGSYELPAECMSVKCISWCCQGNNLLVVKSKGEPLLITAPSGSTRVSTIKCLPFNNVFAGIYSKSHPGLLGLGLENGEVNIYNLETKDQIRWVWFRPFVAAYSVETLPGTRSCLVASKTWTSPSMIKIFWLDALMGTYSCTIPKEGQQLVLWFLTATPCLQPCLATTPHC